MKQKMMLFKSFLAFFAVIQLAFTHLYAQESRPNIIVILADDMGYSDLGCFGGEIETPNLDALSKKGVKMTNFYNSFRCCPSRAALLTGVYPHQAGIGDMMNTRPFAAYQGFLNKESVTLAEVLKSAGYGTYMAGKWHVGQAKENWPLQRGFQRYYGLIDGANSYFDNRPYRPNQKLTIALDNEPVKNLPKNYYSTDAYTDFAIQFIKEHLEQKKNNPFFLYLAYQAPHWPLHAKPEDIKKYLGKYKSGWDEMRKKRFAKQKKLGLIDKNASLPERDEEVKPWNQISDSEKTKWQEKMAVYAAMVDCLDQNVGKLIKNLKENGEWENTIILFMSDNGGSSEYIKNEGFTPEILAANDISPANPESFTSYGAEGAMVSNTPFRKFKHWEFEGGNATNFIAFGPEKYIPKNIISTRPAHIIDIMPTILNVSKATYPKEFNGHSILAPEGKSLLELWSESYDENNERAICFEHEGNRAVRKGKWKLVSQYPENVWYLYDLSQDRNELVDLKNKYPKVLKELEDIYAHWATKVGVIPFEQLDKKRNKK